MSVVTIRGRYRNVAMLAFKKVFLFFISTVIAIAMFSLVDDDGYLFLLQKNTQLGSMVSTMITTVTDTLGITTSGGGGNGKVGASGLNKLMVAKMQAGYAKDYLSICLENEEGKLDTTKREIYTSMESVVATNITETGFYSKDKCKYTLPISDIPSNIVFGSQYGTGRNTLYTYCSSDPKNQDLPYQGGAFAYTSGTGKAGETWTGIHTKSIYNKGTNTPNGIGDAYLMPDCICGMNDFAARGTNEIGFTAKDLDTFDNGMLFQSMSAIFDHNAGSGFNKALYGVCHFAQGKMGTQPKKESIERFNVFANDMQKSINGMSDKNINNFLENLGGAYLWGGAAACLIKQGWSISQEMYDHMTGEYVNTCKQVWSWVYGDKEMSTSEFKTELQKHVSSVSKLTGYSTTECDTIYGTSGGSYSKGILSIHSDYTSQAGYGTAMKLLDGTTNALKGKKNAKRIIAMPGIGLEKTFVVAAFSQKVIARMMIYAGVNEADVFLTTGDSGEDTAGGGSGGTFTTNSKVLDELKAHGCDTKKLTQNRYLVLKAAMQMDGKTYQTPPSCGIVTCGNLNHPTYDCTSFVAHAVAGSGIKDIKKIMKEKGFPGWSGAYPTNKSSGLLVYHPFSGDTSVLKPGDILHHTAAEVGRSYGHAVIFVGMKNGKMCTLEAMGRRYGVGFFPNNRAQSGHDYSHDHRYFSLTVYEDVN